MEGFGMYVVLHDRLYLTVVAIELSNEKEIEMSFREKIEAQSLISQPHPSSLILEALRIHPSKTRPTQLHGLW